MLSLNYSRSIFSYLLLTERTNLLVPLLIIFCQISFAQSITNTINLPVGSKPIQVCVDEQSNKVYVTDGTNARVLEIDGVSKNVLRTFHVPPGPNQCIVNPISKKLYVYCQVELQDQYFCVIDLNNETVDSFYTNQSGYYGQFANFVLNPKLDKVYFLVVFDLWVYNGKTKLLSKVGGPVIFNGPVWVGQIGIDTAMGKVYVPNGGGNVMVVDCQTDNVINTLIVDSDMYARVNVAAVNQEKSLLFVSAWNYTYDKIFSTIDDIYVPPIIDEYATDNWQTIIHEKLNIACRSHEIHTTTELVDMERHTSEPIDFIGYCDGRLVAINQRTAKAFYVYCSRTVVFDLLSGEIMVLEAGEGCETVSSSLQLGSFNQITEELYIPDRVNGVINVIKDETVVSPPTISSVQLNQYRSICIQGNGFGVLQGTSKVSINNNDLGQAKLWSEGFITFDSDSIIGSGLLTINVLDKSVSYIIHSINQDTIDFGEITIGTIDSLRYVVRNLGLSTLEIHNVSIDNNHFTIFPKTATIQPDSSSAFIITFAPVDSSLQTGTIIFSHNAVGSTDSIKVIGRGTNLIIRTIINPNTDGGFESGLNFAENGWTVGNGNEENQWWVGTATIKSGSRSAYISNDSGYSYWYFNPNESTVHFYRDVTFLPSDSNLTLKFDWKGMGDSYWEYMKIYLINITTQPSAGIELTSGQIGASKYNSQPIYTTTTISISSSNIGTTKRLVFSWTNVFVIGTQPPASVDNIQLISSRINPTSVDSITSMKIYTFALNQNYPNPFNPNTVITYQLPVASKVIIKVYDNLGTEIETLVNGVKPAGTFELNWNAANLPSGVYFYRLQAGDFVQTRKMLLLK